MMPRVLEVPQFSQVLPPLPDTPRGISETPMVRVPATASLLRTFQPRSIDSIHSFYSGLRPIYATAHRRQQGTGLHPARNGLWIMFLDTSLTEFTELRVE